MRRSSTSRRRAPQRATSAPKRISATTLNGRTQADRSSRASRLASRLEARDRAKRWRSSCHRRPPPPSLRRPGVPGELVLVLGVSFRDVIELCLDRDHHGHPRRPRVPTAKSWGLPRRRTASVHDRRSSPGSASGRRDRDVPSSRRSIPTAIGTRWLAAWPHSIRLIGQPGVALNGFGRDRPPLPVARDRRVGSGVEAPNAVPAHVARCRAGRRSAGSAVPRRTAIRAVSPCRSGVRKPNRRVAAFPRPFFSVPDVRVIRTAIA